MVGLLSQKYLRKRSLHRGSVGCLQGDPLNKHQRLILLRLEACAPGGILANIAFTDLLASGGRRLARRWRSKSCVPWVSISRSSTACRRHRKAR